jgi:hypothetical protein
MGRTGLVCLAIACQLAGAAGLPLLAIGRLGWALFALWVIAVALAWSKVVVSEGTRRAARRWSLRGAFTGAVLASVLLGLMFAFVAFNPHPHVGMPPGEFPIVAGVAVAYAAWVGAALGFVAASFVKQAV